MPEVRGFSFPRSRPAPLPSDHTVDAPGQFSRVADGRLFGFSVRPIRLWIARAKKVNYL